MMLKVVDTHAGRWFAPSNFRVRREPPADAVETVQRISSSEPSTWEESRPVAWFSCQILGTPRGNARMSCTGKKWAWRLRGQQLALRIQCVALATRTVCTMHRPEKKWAGRTWQIDLLVCFFLTMPDLRKTHASPNWTPRFQNDFLPMCGRVQSRGPVM